MARKSQPWTYGSSPTPRNWHEAANIMKQVPRPSRKSKTSQERFDAIDKMLKDRK